MAWEDIFPNASIEQASAWRVFILGGGSSLFSKIRRKFLFSTCKVHYMPTAFSADKPVKDENDKYIFGVFQNAQIADCMKEEVQRKFTFDPFTDMHNIMLQQEMQACNSVGIHIRKGNDYMSPSNYLISRNISFIYSAINYAKASIDYWYKLVENKRKVRVVINHNNLLILKLKNKT